MRSSLIQSTSFLESIPVTLTMEPKDWINTGLEDEAGGVTVPNLSLERRGGERTRPLRGFDVELRRKPGEGFGFVIASQDVENGKGERRQKTINKFVAYSIRSKDSSYVALIACMCGSATEVVMQKVWSSYLL